MKMVPRRVLVLGATSDIALSTARAFAKRGHSLVLAARDCGALAEECADLRIRHAVSVEAVQFDVLETSSFDAFAVGLDPQPDIVVCAVGVLGNQDESAVNLNKTQLVVRSNFEGPALILSCFANIFEERGSGTLIGISSVAGQRGRASNYIYGSAKAGFTAFLSGLRNRFGRTDIRVVTVMPGFVRTRMTAGMKLPPLLTAHPDEVGEAIFSAWQKGRDVVYVRRIWRIIMFVIGCIPERLFKRLSL